MTDEELKKALITVPHERNFIVAGDPCNMYIKKSYANMQENSNAFEGWALLIKSYFPEAKIILDWNTDIPSVNSKGKNVSARNNAAYNRFLYRLGKFGTLFPQWFHIPKDKQKIVDGFTEEIRTNHINNVCKSDSEYNRDKGIEHIIEKDFSRKDRSQSAFIEKLRAQKILIKSECVFDQLPNGLFEIPVLEKNRKFPTGYFDLWGVDDENNLCIFELKKPQGNDHIGVVSELFFYAWFAYEYYGANINKTKKSKEKYARGYEQLVERSEKLQSGKNPVKAYFLVKQFRSGLDEKINDILTLLNSALNKQGVAITFEVIRYDESWLSARAKEDIAQRKQR